MPKRSKVQIDQDEKNLLSELQNNGDASLDVLAKKLKFSRQKAWRLKKRLERNQAIWGYSAVVDLDENDMKHYTLLIKRTSKPIDEKTLNVLTSNQIDIITEKMGVTVETSSYLNGEYDWMFSFTAEDIKHAKLFCETVYKLLPEFVSETKLIETLFFVKNNHINNPDAKKLKEFF